MRAIGPIAVKGAAADGLDAGEDHPQDLGLTIVEERTKAGPYRSFQDLLQRVKPDLAQARALVRAGCCDSIAAN